MPTLPILQPAAAQQPPAPLTGPPRTEAERRALGADLASAIEGEVRFDLHNRMLYATDASLYQVAPIGVAIPASIDDAMRAVEFCSLRGLPVLPRGGGTSLAGQCTSEAVVLDFSPRCREIVELDDRARTCLVEPGITVDDLNDKLAAHRLFFAPDPATSRQANIGGCIGNNAAGARSIMFGRTSENIVAVEVAAMGERSARRLWLEQGAAARNPIVREMTLAVVDVVQRHERLIRERFPKTVRRNAGYNLDLILRQMDAAGPTADSPAILKAINLAHLVCGSEGTLAVTLQARLALRSLPRAKGLAVVGFASLEEAIDAVQPILASGPSAVELIDDTVLDLAAENTEYRRYIDLMPAPRGEMPRAVLYVEYFAGEMPGELSARFAQLQGIVRPKSPTAQIATYTDPAQMGAAWKLRKAGEPLLHGMPGDRKPVTFVEDNAVPVERLSEFVREFKKIVARHGTGAAYWAHASVGVLHIRPFLDLRSEEDCRKVKEIAVEVADLAKSLGGVMSGEHGDGRVRGPLLERFYGPELMGAFREIKAIFDPRNLLNPGNIVEPGPIGSILERTRLRPAGPLVDVPDVETYFEYADQHGFRDAIEVCNGAGVCRKKSSGTMCPSYMAMLDERHTTRGRANALRLAITGQLAGEGLNKRETSRLIWNDPETLETLDLCLSCKGCKSECPSNVDLARLKAEYIAQGYRASGDIPAAARFFGKIRRAGRLASLAPGFANWAAELPSIRTMLNRAFELAPERELPEFSQPLTRLFRRRKRAALPDGAPTVAIYADCFSTYNESHLGLVAADVLEAFGYRVQLINAGCCGRAMISTGLLGDAARTIDRTIRRLSRAVQEDSPAAILVLEPSCLSAIKDDWLDLKLASLSAERQALASMSFLVEEFLELSWDVHPRRPEPMEPKSGHSTSPILLHGHCHQKALWGHSSAPLLRRLAGDRVRTLDSGCCGMAGSFGYSAKKYELSMKIGELALFPAIRSADADATVCAPGTSCRHQIRDGVDREAQHPVEIIAELLGIG